MGAWEVKESRRIKRAGNFKLGTPLPRNSIKALVNWIAREDGTDNFRIVRILDLYNSKNAGEEEELQKGKLFIHTEYLLLQILKGVPGVCREYGLFRDTILNENSEAVPRVYMVLDCFAPHDYSPLYTPLSNLYLYLKEMKRISEDEAIRIFIKCLTIVERVHEMNIIHRELTLSNFIMNKRTGEIQLVNFGMGRLLTHEKEKIPVQPGSPLYFSPEIVRAQPYLGKPADMWALGIVFYALLFSEFPFHATDLKTLYCKISKMDYAFPLNKPVSPKTAGIVKNLLHPNPEHRLTCSHVLKELLAINSSTPFPALQVVPDEMSSSENLVTFVPKPASTCGFTVTKANHGEIPLTHREVSQLHRAMFRSSLTPVSCHN